MAAHGGKKKMLHVAAVIFAAGLVTLASLAPASAQGIFERIFGGLRRTVEAPAGLPTNIQAFANPFGSPSEGNAPRSETGPASAYCVRTCDGHFFPVQAHAGVSAADACHAFCPASQTRTYSGGGIDHAVAADGSRYADLDTAFLYRQQLVAGCTCNGRDAFGLARVDVNSDPTLRPGDIVATKTGMVAFAGMKNKVADFTPVDSYRGLPKTARDKVSEMKIMPPNPGALIVTPVTLAPSGRQRGNDNRSAQR
jgi:Protein of unknown function (DUF2865)